MQSGKVDLIEVESLPETLESGEKGVLGEADLGIPCCSVIGRKSCGVLRHSRVNAMNNNEFYRVLNVLTIKKR